MLHFAYQCHFQANNFIRGRGMVTCYFQFVGEKCDIQNKCHSISSIKIHAVSCLALENYGKAVLNQKRSNNNLIFSLTLSGPARCGWVVITVCVGWVTPGSRPAFAQRMFLKRVCLPKKPPWASTELCDLFCSVNLEEKPLFHKTKNSNTYQNNFLYESQKMTLWTVNNKINNKKKQSK